MLQVLSAVFVIGGLSNINAIARQKELEFRELTYLDLTTSVFGTAVTVAAAIWLRSVWALVIGQIATAGMSSLLSYFFIGGRARFSWNRDIAVELFKYGKFITGSSIVLFIAMELDSAVIGKLLGIERLGFYALAFTIANLATANLSKIASSVMMPAYSKLQADRPALQRAYLRTFSLVMFAVLPATAGLVVAAEPLVAVVYGEQWLAAVRPLQILAVFGFLRALAAFNGYLFEGIGLPKVAFQLGILRLLVIALLIVPMSSVYGLEGAALTVTLGIAIQWVLGLGYLSRHLDIGVSQIASSCRRSLTSTLAMAIVIYCFMLVVPTSTPLGFAALVLAGIGTYGSLNVSILRELRKERMG